MVTEENLSNGYQLIFDGMARGKDQFDKIHNSCYIMSHWVISKLSPIINGFDNNINQQLLTEWLIYLINCSKNRFMLIEDSTYFAGANHPTKQGHLIWANYILESI